MPSSIEKDIQASGLANVIVYLKEGVDTAGARSATGYFVGSPHSVAASVLAAQGRRAPAKSGRYFSNLGVMLGTVDSAALKNLRGLDTVREVRRAPELSWIRPVSARTAKLSGTLTWGLRQLKVQRLWTAGHKGDGVKVGHLDTGVDGRHAALRTAIDDFVFIDRIGAVTRLREGQVAYDTDDHGTHTAATIAGRPVSGRHVGVAPEAMLCSAAVIEGGDVVARILGGLNWAVGKRVKLVSASLGLRGWVDDFLGIVRIVRARGVLPVFAVGNEGPGTSRSPVTMPRPCRWERAIEGTWLLISREASAF